MAGPWRALFGEVRRGADVVENALVRAEASPRFLTDRTRSLFPPVWTETDGSGIFRGIATGASRYDLLVRLDAPDAKTPEVLVFRELAARYFDPYVEGPELSSKGWTSSVEVVFDREPPPGRSVAFFGGEGVTRLSGDRRALSLVTDAYTRKVSLHAVEYETAGGLAAATAYARADDVFVESGAHRLVNMALRDLDPESEFASPTFEIAAPSPFTEATVELRFGFTPTSYGSFPPVPVGTVQRIPLVPNALYTYRAVAAQGGAVSETGERSFDVRGNTMLTFPTPPALDVPSEGESRAPGESFVVDAADAVFEHLLAPRGAGPLLRLYTADRETTLPDVTTLGLMPLSGPYTWTVRKYPAEQAAADQPAPRVMFVETLNGRYSRRYRSSATSAPRTVLLR